MRWCDRTEDVSFRTRHERRGSLGPRRSSTMVDPRGERFVKSDPPRDGALAFDLPARLVTRELLTQLYDQFEHELRGEVPADEPEMPGTPQPVVMHCR